MSALEFVATFCGILYLGFISYHKRIGWVFGCVSSGIYIVVCSQQELFIQAGLQFLYVILGLLGYIKWNQNFKIIIKRISIKSHLGILVLGLILSLFLGKLMSITDQQLPYLDALISIFSIVATILATRSILENWIYWIFANLFSIFLFAMQGLYITTFLYCIYFFGSIFGYYNWTNMVKTQSKMD